MSTQDHRLAGKVAIVTGGASGIGAACAKRLAGSGASVLLTDVDTVLGEQVAADICAAGGQAKFTQHDVTDEAQWEQVVALCQSHFGGLNILVNNAGIAIMCDVFEMSLADWQRQQAVNLDGVFLGVKHCVPVMKDMPAGGSVINISSVAGLQGAAGLSAYNATKGGVRLFTKGVALECGRNGWPVRVNSVHPGIIATPIWDKIDPSMAGEGANNYDPDEMSAAAVPVGVAGQAADIANGVLFLASDESSYMTGSELVIDGGISA
jgi:NAD(P)-dependent dehydrogenase (short-subunit alcohol dehydrogenase family)